MNRFCIALTILLFLVSGRPSTGLADEEQPIVPEQVKLDRPVDFDQDIAPIFRANCVACHNKAKSEGDLILESGEAIMKGGSSGAVVVPGKPEESYLYNVAARIEESFMPPWPNEVQAKKLTPREVGLLKLWIAEGAKAGKSSSTADMQWQPINDQLSAIYAVDTDPTGRFVAAGRAGSVTVYDLLAQRNIVPLVDPALIEKKSPSQRTHLDYVHSIAFHPAGDMLATSGFQVVKLWQRQSTPIAASVQGAPIKVARLISRSDRGAIATQTADGAMLLWDEQNGAFQSVLSAEQLQSVTVLGFSGGDTARVAVSNAEGIVRLLNLKEGVEIAVSEPLQAKPVQAAIAPNGDKVTVLLENGTLQLLTLNAEAKTLTAAEPVKSDKGAIKDIGRAEAVLMCRVEGNIVELRNADSLQPGPSIQCSGPVAHAAVSVDAQRVVTVSSEGTAELWNAKDAKRLATLDKDLAAVRTLAQRTRNKAVRDSRVKVVQGQITEDEKRVTEQKESLKKADEEIKKATEALAAAHKKYDELKPKTAAAKKASEEKPDDDGLKKKLEAAQKADDAEQEAVRKAEEALKSAKKGKQLTEDAIKRAEAKVVERKAHLVKVEAEAKVAAEAHMAADAAAKQTVKSAFGAFVGSELVATVDSGGTTRLFRTSDGQPVDSFAGTLSEAQKPVAVVAAADTIMVQSADGTLSSINPFPAWNLVRTLGPQSEGQPSAFADRVLSLAFSPDGATLATGGGEASRSGELMLWNVADGKLLRTFEDAHSDTVYGIDFSEDGKMLASAAADKFVKVFDVATGQHVRSYEGHTHHVMDVSWKGDRTALASAGADNAIKVWNAETGEQSRTISTYKKQVTSLSFIGMENEFISCSGDKRVFRHRADNGGTVREFKGCPDYVYCSATTADGMVIAAGCEDGILRIWNGKDAKIIASFGPETR